MSLLQAEFDDAESEYQHGHLETHPDEIASEPEENSDDEQKEGEEESEHIAEGELVKIESSFEDRTEQVKVDDFLSESCGCKLGPHRVACSSVVSKVAIVQTRNNCLQMTRAELDLVIMAQINALRTQASDRPPSQHGEGGFRPHMKFFFHGMQVCQKVFLFLHAISTKRFKNLCASVSKHGVHDRRHGNTGKMPHNACSFASIEHASLFIQNMAATHGLPLPGRLPSCEDKVVVLPSDMTKMHVYRSYKAACVQLQLKPMQKTAFYKIWQDLHPSIGTMKPATDLCFECQQFMTRIVRSAHLSEDEKSSRLHEAETHLKLAREERKLYNEQIKQCKEVFNQGSVPSTMHYSFDYAQQVHFPNNPQQPGPAYFLTARKCQLFGVTCEPTGVQMNYLIDESETIGKGANATISLLHHFLEVHGLKEANLLLHADNCVGQNKNNALIHYLMWLVATGRYQSVQLSFMLAGHTKFAPDRHFGLIKKAYHRTRVDTISSIQRVVENSSICGANKAQLIRGTDGNVHVHYYDWSEFLKQYYKTIPSLTKYHNFIVRHDHPAKIIIKEHSQAAEESLIIGTRPVPKGVLPTQIHPKGLDAERQWYLYEKIRPFCSSVLAADITCPKPLQSKSTASALELALSSPSSPVMRAGTKRKPPTCSSCRCEGHTKRTCPTK